MAINIGKPNICLEDITDKVSDIDILNYYFGIIDIPCVVKSPLRQDNKPSFGFYSLDGTKIYWVDYATKDKGGVFDLLEKYWGVSYKDVLNKLWEDLPNFTNINSCNKLSQKVTSSKRYNEETDLQCKVREWKDYDIKYWESYGITLEWLKYADIYPVSHKIIIKDGHRYVFGVDKYAYAYVERKEGNITLKIYQPLVKDKRRKWCNKHDRSVISLWTKVPEYGDKICVCSSMKDALCLWANTGIPAISLQGEGYGMSDTAISELKRRYKHVYILLDNDEVGTIDSLKLSASTGFTNIILPKFEGGKDVSDYYKSLQDPKKFKETILKLFSYD